MNILQEDIIDFMKLLNKNEVKYILVGGLAVNYYGYSRTTGDIHLWLDDSDNNRKCLVNALTEFGVDGANAFLTHPLVAGYAEILLGDGIYLDFMADMITLKQDQFQECFQLAEKFQLNEETAVHVLHINKLIEEKTKSTRPKDIEDAKQLRIIANSKRK